MKNKRQIIQNGFLGLWLIALISMWTDKIHTSHQFCPFASVCFGTLIPKGYAAYVPAIIIGSIIALTSFFWGRKFCGYICFFGTLQEKIYKIFKRKKHLKINTKLDFVLKSVKYIILFGIIFLVCNFLAYKYMDFCPVIAISFPLQITIWGALSLVLIFLLGIFIERFWCRYICPYAALMNIFIYLGKLLHIKRKVIRVNTNNCISCNLCNKACPMNINIVMQTKVTDPNCIYCENCIDKCPKDGIIIG